MISLYLTLQLYKDFISKTLHMHRNKAQSSRVQQSHKKSCCPVAGEPSLATFWAWDASGWVNAGGEASRTSPGTVPITAYGARLIQAPPFARWSRISMDEIAAVRSCAHLTPIYWGKGATTSDNGPIPLHVPPASCPSQLHPKCTTYNLSVNWLAVGNMTLLLPVHLDYCSLFFSLSDSSEGSKMMWHTANDAVPAKHSCARRRHLSLRKPTRAVTNTMLFKGLFASTTEPVDSWSCSSWWLSCLWSAWDEECLAANCWGVSVQRICFASRGICSQMFSCAALKLPKLLYQK